MNGIVEGPFVRLLEIAFGTKRELMRVLSSAIATRATGRRREGSSRVAFGVPIGLSSYVRSPFDGCAVGVRAGGIDNTPAMKLPVFY